MDARGPGQNFPEREILVNVKWERRWFTILLHFITCCQAPIPTVAPVFKRV